MPPVRWSISSSSRNICSSPTPPTLPEILDTSTARVLDKAARLGVLAVEDAEVLRPAVRLFHDLAQILRLCLTGPFDPKSAGPGVLALLARAADLPDFSGARGACEGDAAEGAGVFCADFGGAP